MNKIHPAGGRTRERLYLSIISILLLLSFYQLFTVLQGRWKDTERKMAEGTVVNLNGPEPARALQQLLTGSHYLEDARDVHLIGRTVAAALTPGEKFTNTGELNKRRFYLSAAEAAATGGESFQRRAKLSRALLGFTGSDEDRYTREAVAPEKLPPVINLSAGKSVIKGQVTQQALALSGTLVRLSTVWPADSADAKSFTAYVRTDAKGNYAFTGLPEGKAYQIIPLKPGFEFGQLKGTPELGGSATFDFQASPHTIRLLSLKDFNALKTDGALIVRTPQEFSLRYWIVCAGLLASFVILHLVLTVRFPGADQLIVPLLLLLTGISFLTLLGLQDPLRDRFLALDALRSLVIGMGVLTGLLFLNLGKFTPDSSFYRLFLFRDARAANGWPWILLAVLLLSATLLLGSGPEGSGVKVNLLGVQPSEVVKYLVVLFLAGFFARNEPYISAYASWKKRWSFFYTALGAVLLTLLLFLLLGDLGPAIVICFTFIILFSFCRGDFMEMAVCVLLYVLLAWITGNVWLVVLSTAALLSAYWIFSKKRISESALMALVVLTAFLSIDQLPYLENLLPGPVQRLADRKAIWQDPWNNDVYGGDQVANGLWAIASGGVRGQGFGKDYAKTVPEAHTDMILPAIGESLGWVGICCIFLLFLIYQHRAIIIGRQSGRPFLFYLCSGIGLCTFVQFLLIAGGSVGALPLSGVSLPFESYGGSSLVINLAAAGFLLSASSVSGTAVQMKYLKTQQDRNLVPALLSACATVLLLLMNVSRYSFQSKDWLVRPALVADKSGNRMFSYNPRIAILMKKLAAGNLYDRSGLVLATSDPSLISRQGEKLRQAGAGGYDLDAAQRKRDKRFYPFADQLFFWTGDANTGIFNGGTNGYFAEYEHAAELRGFKTTSSSFTITASHYQEDRFLPRRTREMLVVKKDYSAIVPLLVSGLDSAEIGQFKKRNRDVRLSVDARLQTEIQQALSADASVRSNRVSVVVMSSGTGDVLASAMHPLPPLNNWEQLNMSIQEQNQLSNWVTTADPGFTVATQPGSTAKLLTAMAAFNKIGKAAAQQRYLVSAAERIRSGGPEPDETGNIDMERAIVKSNNVYFIKLANQQHLQVPMAELYLQTGMFLHGVGGYYYNRKAVTAGQRDRWFKLWERTEFSSPYNPANIYRNRATGISGMAWGQGELIATPAAVARLGSAIANQGLLVPSNYVLEVNGVQQQAGAAVPMAKDPAYAAALKQFMIEQSAGKAGFFGLAVAGKTGTPERIVKKKKVNDGWYVFFAPTPSGAQYTVVCIRIEATRGSSDAVRLAGEKVIPVLVRNGYLKSIN